MFDTLMVFYELQSNSYSTPDNIVMRTFKKYSRYKQFNDNIIFLFVCSLVSRSSSKIVPDVLERNHVCILRIYIM